MNFKHSSLKVSGDSDAEAGVCKPLQRLDEQVEVELSSLLDLQNARIKAETKQANSLIFRCCSILMILGLLAYAISPSLRRGVSGLVQNFQESMREDDSDSVPKIVENTYQDVLKKLGSRSNDIDHATQSLGVDPRTVKEDGMDAEMKSMMGGEGRTAGERQRSIERVAHLMGVELPKPSAFDNTPPKPQALGPVPTKAAGLPGQK